MHLGYRSCSDDGVSPDLIIRGMRALRCVCLVLLSVVFFSPAGMSRYKSKPQVSINVETEVYSISGTATHDSISNQSHNLSMGLKSKRIPVVQMGATI